MEKEKEEEEQEKRQKPTTASSVIKKRRRHRHQPQEKRHPHDFDKDWLGWSGIKQIQFLHDRDPRTPVTECSTKDKHTFLFRVFVLLFLQLGVTFTAVYALTSVVDLAEFSAEHPWMYAITAVFFVVLAIMYFTKASKRWELTWQALLCVAEVLIMIFVLSVIMVAVRAELVFHVMAVILTLLLMFALFCCQNVLEFSFWLAIFWSIAFGLFIAFILVYLPEQAHLHNIEGLAYLSESGWHILSVTFLGVVVVVFMLMTLAERLQHCRRVDFLWLTFDVYFYVTALMLLMRELSKRCVDGMSHRAWKPDTDPPLGPHEESADVFV